MSGEFPSPAYDCVCGQLIYKQSGDDRLVCYDCGREYDPVVNRLQAVHVLCPNCSVKITEFGKEVVEQNPDRWRVDDVRCPRCEYEYVSY